MCGEAAQPPPVIDCPLIANSVTSLDSRGRSHTRDRTEAGEAEGDDESFAHRHVSFLGECFLLKRLAIGGARRGLFDDRRTAHSLLNQFGLMFLRCEGSGAGPGPEAPELSCDGCRQLNSCIEQN